MKKSDLKDGMVLEVREGDKFILINNLLIGNTWYELDKYNWDLINEDKHLSDKRSLDIVKIYEISDGYGVRDILEPGREYGLELLWEREEVDWSKVPFGAKVLCYDYAGDTKLEGRLLSYSKDSEIPFQVFIEASNECYIFRKCELIEEPKEDITYDNLVDEIREHCHKTKCLNCAHDNYNDCKYAYILENYNVTRKDI